ncbi:AAA family ATPase [Desulfococcaceae bacterium HSG7]|nr:AAA family ATPase [Desulfococcaceae bacterium HSG7]
MIKSFTIKGFKQFADLSLQSLKPVTLIGGKNNTGKTTVLEAFLMFYDRGNPQVTMRHLSHRGVGSIALNPDSLWSPIFHSYDMAKSVEMEICENGTKEKIRIRYNKEFQKSVYASPSTQGSVPEIQTGQQSLTMESLDFSYYVNDKKAGESHITLDGPRLNMHTVDLRKPSKIAAFIGSGVQRNPTEDSARFGQLDIHGHTDIITDVLKIIEPNLKSLTTISQGEHALIYGNIGLPRKIPVTCMGEGTAKLLSIILAIATNANGMVLIDEIENGWHYSLLPNILKAIHKMAKKYNCQIIATTHSYEINKALIKGLSPEDLSDVAYIRLDKEKERIKPKIYETGMLAAALERGWEIR